jgi:16S rRNA (guanine1207-N2)-methyltransferase
MDPRSEVVIRQQDYLNGQVLLINAPNDQLAKNLPHQVQASVWTWNYADHQGFQSTGINSYFSVEFPQASFDQVVIFVPKSKELLNYILHVVVSQLTLGQSVFLVGEKKAVLNVLQNNSCNMVKPLKLIVHATVNFGT